jgi:hypothetical protein
LEATLINDFLGGALVAIIGVTLVLVGTDWTLRKHLAIKLLEAGDLFVFSNVYRAGCVGFGALVLFSNYALVVHNTNTGIFWDITGALWMFGFLPWSWYLIYNSFIYNVRLETDGISVRQLGSAKKILWEEIARIEWVESGRSFHIVGTNGHRLKIGIFTLGIQRLFDQVRSRAPEVDISEVQEKLSRLK